MAQSKQSPKRRSVSRDERKSAAAKKTPRQKKQRTARHRWPRVVFGCLLALVVASAGILAWDRWFRHDDNADMQGTWKLANTTVLVVIDSDEIVLSSDVRYEYTLDTWAKTITFTFGSLNGFGRYQFSPDRSILIIVDGEPSDIVGDFAREFGLKPFDEVSDIANLSYMTKVSSG